jgi:hypothetical protein
MLSFALNLFFVAVLSFGQLNHLLTFWGIQTDLVLVSIIIFSLFEKDWLRRSALILLAVIILSFEPAFSLNTLVTIIVFFMSIFLLDVLRWEPFFNTILTIIISTTLINASALRAETIAIETALNLLFAVILALCMNIFVSRSKN